MAQTPRLHKDLAVVHAITGKFDASADSSGKEFDDAIPKGAIVKEVQSHVSTAFGGTLPTITVGVTGDLDAFANSVDTDVVSTGIKDSSPGTLETAVYIGPLAASVVPKFTKGGTSVTTGVIYTTIFYTFPHFTQYDN